MDIRRAVSDFIVHGGELLSRLLSYKGKCSMKRTSICFASNFIC